MINSELIGRIVEYESAGRVYSGRIIDKVRIMGRGEDEGLAFDLYLISMPNGRIYKISPASIKQIIAIEK